MRLLKYKKMNRLIRFRAFDDGKMIYEKNIQHLTMEYNTILRLAKFWSNVRNDSIIMQFTGLHDKNGKEIYEGDIVTYSGITSNNEKIIRIISYNTDYARFQSGMYLLDNIELIEVIGNIYENPELLNK